MGYFNVNEDFIKIIMAESRDRLICFTSYKCKMHLYSVKICSISYNEWYSLSHCRILGRRVLLKLQRVLYVRVAATPAVLRDARAHTHIYMYRLPLARWRALAGDARWNVTDALRVIARRFSQSALNWPINTPPRSYDFIQSERAWSRNVRPY